MKARKKPVIVDYIQWNGNNLQACIDFLGDDYLSHHFDNEGDEITMKTLEGQHVAIQSDYIIRGIKGEHYPLKSDIFDLTYDKL